MASHLIYCNIIWCNTYRAHTDPISKLQKRALRVCLNIKGVTSNDPFTSTNRLSLSNLNKMLTMLLVYNWFYNIKPLSVNISSMFSKTNQIHNHSTRQITNLSLFTHSSRILSEQMP